MSDGAHGLNIEDIDFRVSERFGKDALRPWCDCTPDGIVVADVHKNWIDANLAKGNVELVNSAAVKRR